MTRIKYKNINFRPTQDHTLCGQLFNTMDSFLVVSSNCSGTSYWQHLHKAKKTEDKEFRGEWMKKWKNKTGLKE